MGQEDIPEACSSENSTNEHSPLLKFDGTSSDSDTLIQTEVNPKRWAILVLACVSAFVNGLQNVIYAGLPSSARHYYKVTTSAFDMLTSLYFFMFALCGIFYIWVMMKIGNRKSMILSSALILMGSVIALLACINQSFYVMAIFAQILNGMGQIFVLSLPPKLAGTWFDSRHISSATSLIVFSYQAGNGVALIVPPYVISPSISISGVDLIRNQMLYVFGFIAASAAVVFVLIVLFFDDKPPLPPSTSAALADAIEAKSFTGSLKEVLRNGDFRKFILSFGLNYATFATLETVMVVQILKIDGSTLTDRTAGQIAATFVFAGISGCIIFGVWLDKTKTFLGTSKFVFGASVVSLSLYTIALHSLAEWPLWVTCILCGIFLTAYMNIGMEIASELTYPEPASNSTSLIYSSGGAFTLILTAITQAIMSAGYVLESNIFLTVVLAVAFLITLTIKGEMKRYNASIDAGECSSGS